VKAFKIPEKISQGGHFVRKYYMVKWKILCRPKDRGGVGIKNLDK
jgi:hypothetical protein